MSIGGPSLYGINKTGRVIESFNNSEPFDASETTRIILSSFIDVSSFRTLYVSITTDIPLAVSGLFSNDYGAHVAKEPPQNVPADGSITTIITYDVVGATANFKIENIVPSTSSVFHFSVYGSKQRGSFTSDPENGAMATYERLPDLEWGPRASSNFTTPVIDVTTYASLTISTNQQPPSAGGFSGNFGGARVEFLEDDPTNPGTDFVTFSVQIRQNLSEVDAVYRGGGLTASTPVLGSRVRIVYSVDSDNTHGSVVFGNRVPFIAPFPRGSLYPLT